jgi:hypothetical protein
MTIQPLSNRPREISVTEVIEPAYERVKQMLFRPFDLTKWIVIGFCAWLAGLGESGGGGGGGFNNSFNNHNDQSAEKFREFYHKASEFVMANLDWIIPLFIFLVLLGLVLWLLILWISSRGKFMFLHCVALDKAEIEAPWRKFAKAANSLFWFRLVVGVIAMFLIFPIVILIAASVIRMVQRGEPDFAGIMLSIGLGLVLLFVSLTFALIHKFMVDFVVPIMFLRNGTCLEAWREFWGLLSANPGKFTLYILFQIVISIAIGAIVLMAILITCCIAFCFLALPFVGTVLLLPILIFKRAYSLYYLAQYGPEYDVFPKPPIPPIAPAQPTPFPAPVQ